MSNRSYVVITPVRDEEAHIEKTIQSLVSQTMPPLKWVIVNDGSIDRTGEIVKEYALLYPWIQMISRENRGFRKPGGGVVEAFYEGYNVLGECDWDYIVKLDGDLSFSPDYFEKCLDKFKDNPKLGIAGGFIYHFVNGVLQVEDQPLFHVRGATKIYKRECWEAIGQLIQAPGWDTLDEVKSRMLGWETLSFPELKLLHHRYTGAADGNWKNSVKNGLANYISGYHPVFMMAKCIKRLWKKPFLLGSAGLLYGFLKGYAKRLPRVDDPKLIKYLRKEQLNKLLFRKTIWN